MSIEKRKKLTKYLCILWVVSYILICIFFNLYSIHQSFVHNEPATPLSVYTVSFIVIMAVYLIPLMITIHYHAKMAEMKKIKTVSFILIIFFSVWAILSFAVMGLYLFFSGAGVSSFEPIIAMASS